MTGSLEQAKERFMKDRAIAKLDKALVALKNPGSKALIIQHLKDRVSEDERFAEAVLSDEKSFERCWGYISDNVRKQAADKNFAIVDDSTVFGWAEGYFRDQKPHEMPHKPQEPSKKEKLKEPSPEAEKAERKAYSVVDEGEASEAKQEEKRPKKGKKKTDEESGQMSIFDLLGGDQ